MLDLASLRALLGVPPLYVPDNWIPAAVVIDSRQARPGGLFVALAGQHSDGHDFLPAAFAGGCEAALVSRMPADPRLAARCLCVDHTGLALDGIAGLARRLYQGPVAAITGSNGKTTTKQLVLGILKRERYPGASPGNLNSTVGAPLAFLNHSADTDCWIQETGASDFGEIARICAWLKPDAGVITSIGEAHLESFGDLAGVVRAKSELLEAVAQRGGRILLNTGDPFLATLAGRWPGAMEFGLEQGLELAEGHLCFSGLGEDGCGRFRLGRQDMALAVPGLAFAECALCAAALAAALGSGAGAILAGLAGWSDPGGAGGPDACDPAGRGAHPGRLLQREPGIHPGRPAHPGGDGRTGQALGRARPHGGTGSGGRGPAPGDRGPSRGGRPGSPAGGGPPGRAGRPAGRLPNTRGPGRAALPGLRHGPGRAGGAGGGGTCCW
jgi:hypothetical protein